MSRDDGSARRWVDRPAAYVLALFVLLLCLLPPDGVLSDNEEDYFQLAAHFVSAKPVSPYSAVFDASWHRVVNDLLLGELIHAVGFGAAQMIVRGFAALAYALMLRAIFRRFALSTLDAVLVVAAFALMGQAIIGGEWLFNGYEAKVAAYCLVLAGLAVVLDAKRLVPAALLFGAATYFHLLVGIFWFFAAMVLALIEERRGFRRVALAVLVFILAAAPLVGVIAVTRISGQAVPDVPGMPSPDVIYSIIRAPHHTSPFLDFHDFLSQWLPGYLLAAAMLGGCLVVRLTPKTSPLLSSTAIWLSLLLAYLFLALIPSFVDRHTGVLGKFYLFRPSSLILLLWLALALAWFNRLGLPRSTVIKSLALAVVLPLFLRQAAIRVTSDIEAGNDLAAEKRALAEVLAREAQPQATVLIDPQLDLAFLDFERLTGHPSLVSWKFMPTTDRGIVEWYERMAFRRTLFEDGCTAGSRYPVDFVLTAPERAAALSSSCGTVIHAGRRVVLLRHAS
jgi:hypothetical protein